MIEDSYTVKYKEEVEIQIEFPFTLVHGNNGQEGIDLYNYLNKRLPSNNTTIIVPNEEYGIGDIIIQNWGNVENIVVYNTEETKLFIMLNELLSQEGWTPSLRTDGRFF